jgi:methylenetetrahydrofolate dehydrogenase (NADP+)/methenyltetrahydrofolate cyclohydrolase
MSARRIDGRAIADAIKKRVAQEIAGAGIVPGLGVVLVGEDPASRLYVGLKEKACRDAGIRFERHDLPATATRAEILRVVVALNAADDVDAILVQLPLPDGIDEDVVIAAMDPAKDVDGFHPATVAALEAGTPTVVPGLAAGIMTLIASAEQPLHGKRALVIANSDVFYRPLAKVLGASGLVPSFRVPDAEDVADRAREADVLVVAVGRAGFVTPPMVKPDAIIIDVGTNRTDAGLVGDVARDVAEVAGHLTPVPGGVGPVTVAMLLANTLALAELRRNKK